MSRAEFRTRCRAALSALSLPAVFGLSPVTAVAGGFCHPKRVVLVPTSGAVVVREAEPVGERVVVREYQRVVPRAAVPPSGQAAVPAPTYPAPPVGAAPTPQAPAFVADRPATRLVREIVREYEEPVPTQVVRVQTVPAAPAETCVVREAVPVRAVVVRRKNCLTKW